MTEPAPWLIAVWENPPADGIARNSAPATQAMPLAASSWLLSIDGSALRRTLWATAAVSRKHMMAMANAPGASPATLSNDGPTGVGSPDGTGGDESHAVFVERRDADEHDAEHHGEQWRRDPRDDPADPNRTASVAAENATVVQLTSPRSSTIPATSAKKLEAVGSPWIPSSLGSWPAATVKPTPILIPVNVASEMLSIRAPRCNSLAASRITPTSIVSIARSPTGSVPSAATPAASSVDPESRATVDVVLTDNVRDPPSRA